MYGIASKSGINLEVENINEPVVVYATRKSFFVLCKYHWQLHPICQQYRKHCSKIIDRSKIEIVIRDDGPGIDSNELPNIFERFYKGKKVMWDWVLPSAKHN